MEKFFFDSWESIFRTAVIAPLSYFGLLLMLRAVGSRALSQLNAFDLIVTVALGSTLATAILTKNVPLADGLLGFAMLIGLQWAITKLSVRFRPFRDFVKTEPKLLYFKGKYLEKELKQSGITEDEILQVVRSAGMVQLDNVDAIVLETNGKFSVINKNVSNNEESAFKNIYKAEKHVNQ